MRAAVAAALIAAPLANHPALNVLAFLLLLGIGLVAYARRRVFQQRLRELPAFTATDNAPKREHVPRVSAIVPARNEADRIEEAVRSLASSAYPALEVIAVDDHSTDETGAILDRLAGPWERLRVIHDPELRPGWLGKANAVWTGVQASDPEAGWLLLTDADVVHCPTLLGRAVAHAEEHGLDLLTLLVYQDNQTFAEELLLPFAWANNLISARPDRLNRPDAWPVGIGAFMLVRRPTYLESGGHSAAPAQQPEDNMLTATVRAHGGRIGLGYAPGGARVRLYAGWRGIAEALPRKARALTAGRRLNLVYSALTYFTLLFLPLPVALGFLATQAAAGRFSVTACACAGAGFLAYAVRGESFLDFRKVARLRPVAAWLHPLSGLILAGMMLRALIASLGRRPMQWRGRPFVEVEGSRSSSP